MAHYIEPADLAEAEYDDLHPHTAPTVAEQQCGREPDAYEVRCTDGNYEWRRPYHGELEVIMRTGRDRSGKPFEYRALFADAPASRGATPAEVAGLVERLRDRATVMETLSPDFASACREAASLIQSQAAELAEMKENCETVCNSYADENQRLYDRAERAEAALAEARKALEPFADIADLIDSETEGMSETDELALHFHDYLMASWPVALFRAARRVREGGEADG